MLPLLMSLPIHAAIVPNSQNFDNRITEIKYNPSDVTLIYTALGVSTLIQLQPGENINSKSGGIGIGDKKAWGVSSKENNIFIKPVAMQADTNLLITTNLGRTYAFELIDSKTPHYIVKITYPKPKTAEDNKPDIPCYDGDVNFAYGKWGDLELSPSYMWDDGRFTCLKFTDNAELPIPYQVTADGEESLINYNIESDTIILHGIASEFRLRLGKQVLGLQSEKAVFAGHNKKGSTIKLKRELIQ